MNNPVIIFGAGTLGKIALDIFNENEVLIYGILDDKKELHGQEIGNIVVLGSTNDENFLKLIGKQTESFVAIQHKDERKKLAELLQESKKNVPVNAIHKSAIVSSEAEVGHGNLISAATVIGAFSKIGNLNIFGSGCIIDAGSQIGNYVEIGSGSVINADVVIEDGAFIGSNVTLVSGITIGKNARIGAGSVVIANVKAKQTVFGNPAKAIEK